MVDIAWPALGVLAAAALVVGVYLGADWLGTDPDDRATTTIILAAWNVLVGLWLGDEVMRMRRGEADGVESIVLGCALTAVLAGVGLSRDLAETGAGRPDRPRGRGRHPLRPGRLAPPGRARGAGGGHRRRRRGGALADPADRPVAA